ncbi:GIY-YIG nuclease family protein [Patescibacteria group bacterium]|jgi:putative endonuclease|nr:GIY-YIG nuclease family protein [Patescibacteria group bacterium]
MYFVYVLRSLTDGGWYVGFTEDVDRRLQDHNQGKNVSTKPRRPFVLIYYEAYLNKYDALGREKFLKSGSGRRFLEKQMRHYLGCV